MNLNRPELEMIMNALASEARTLRTMRDELERRNLHMGMQNVELDKRTREVTALMGKVNAELLSI